MEGTPPLALEAEEQHVILIGDEEPVMQGVVRKRSRPVVSPEIVIDEEEPVPPCVGGKKPRPAEERRSGKARACATVLWLAATRRERPTICLLVAKTKVEE